MTLYKHEELSVLDLIMAHEIHGIFGTISLLNKVVDEKKLSPLGAVKALLELADHKTITVEKLLIPIIKANILQEIIILDDDNKIRIKTQISNHGVPTGNSLDVAIDLFDVSRTLAFFEEDLLSLSEEELLKYLKTFLEYEKRNVDFWLKALFE